ncbi:THAP domain-containing 11, partial [Paramuricea clavata]
ISSNHFPLSCRSCSVVVLGPRSCEQVSAANEVEMHALQFLLRHVLLEHVSPRSREGSQLQRAISECDDHDCVKIERGVSLIDRFMPSILSWKAAIRSTFTRFGSCTACHQYISESKSTGVLYFFLLILVLTLILEIGAGIVGFIWRDDVQDDLPDEMGNALDKYKNGDMDIKKAWEKIHDKPNSSSFQNSCTSLVSEIPLGSISDCLLPSLEEKSTPKSTYHSGGGITCCVPNCFNNSIRNKELSFYVIPKDSNLRKKWLHMLKRKNFVPSSSHRVCSAHFVGGTKTYMNNIPTINVPMLKSTTPTTAKPRTTRNSSEGRMRSALLPKKLRFEQDVENKEPEEAMNELKRLRKENQTLKEKIEQLTKEHSKKVEDLTNTITVLKQEHNKKVEELTNTITELKLKQNEFSLETFKDNPKLFMFYTGFQSYDLFKIFFEFLGPAVNKINYWGSNTRNDDSVTPESSKRGPKRQMNPEQELFIVLARLRCGLLEQDLASVMVIHNR